MPHSQQQIDTETKNFFQKVYAWMFLGLAITGIVAYLIASSPMLIELILTNQVVFYSILISQLIVVIVFAATLEKISAKLAVFLFLLYSFIVGLTFSSIFLIFTIDSIGLTFFITAGMFGAMSAYGYLTKKNLSGLGPVLLMGLVGVIIASLANFFLKSESINYLLCFISIIIFTGLTMYDTQKLKKLNVIGNEGSDSDKKEAVNGALTLYLDFINLFLNLLRLFGKRK